MGESGSYGGSDTNNAGRMLEDFPEGMTVVFVFRGHDVSFLCSGFGNVETVQAASKKNLAFAAQVRRFRPDAALRSGGHGGGRKARRQIFCTRVISGRRSQDRGKPARARQFALRKGGKLGFFHLRPCGSGRAFPFRKRRQYPALADAAEINRRRGFEPCRHVEPQRGGKTIRLNQPLVVGAL
jgi:hypothetical protein